VGRGLATGDGAADVVGDGVAVSLGLGEASVESLAAGVGRPAVVGPLSEASWRRTATTVPATASRTRMTIAAVRTAGATGRRPVGPD
jgi:hypothetical protein